MKIAIIAGEGIIVRLFSILYACIFFGTWVKRVRIIVYDTKKKRIIVDRLFSITFSCGYSELKELISFAWKRTFRVHKCWFDAPGNGNSESVNRIIRIILNRNNVKKIFYKGKLMFNFLNEINLEGIFGEEKIIHDNMYDLGKEYDVSSWTQGSGFSREDRAIYYLNEYLKEKNRWKILKKYLNYKM